MSESRFNVDDILREVEQMRSTPSKTTVKKAESVSSDVKPEPKQTLGKELPKEEPPAEVDGATRVIEPLTEEYVGRHAKPTEESETKINDFLRKTEDTGYTPGQSKTARSNAQKLYDTNSDLVVNPLKKQRHVYNPNVLTPDEINANTIVSPTQKLELENAIKKLDDEKFEFDKAKMLEYEDTDNREIEGEIDDYHSIKDADEVRDELKSKKFAMTARMVITLICACLSATLTVLPMTNFNPLPEFITQGIGLILIQGGLLTVALITNFMSVIRGFFSIFALKGQIDSPPAVAVAAAIAQLAYLSFIPEHATYNTVFTAVALFALFCNLYGKRMLLTRVYKNFNLIATADAKQSAFVASEQSGDKIAPENIGHPAVCCQRSVINLQNYMHNSLCEDPADIVGRIFAPLALLTAAIAGIIMWVTTFNMTFVFSTIASFAAVSVPIANLISTNRPLSTLCHGLREMGAVVTGYNAIKEFSDVNGAVLTDEDLFPAGAIELVSVKSLGDKKINEVMMLASALAIASKGAIADVFDRVIEGRRESLPEVSGVVCRDGEGVAGVVDGLSVKIGTRKLMRKDGVVDLPDNDFEEKMARGGNYPYYISINGELCGLFLLRHNNIIDNDNLSYLRRLTRAGVDIYVKTNDPYVTSELVGDLFIIPKKRIYILNSAQKAECDKISRPSKNGESFIAHTNSTAAFATALAGCKRVRTRIAYGVLIQILVAVAGVIGLAFFMINQNAIFTTAAVLLGYQVASVILTAIFPRFFSLK